MGARRETRSRIRGPGSAIYGGNATCSLAAAFSQGNRSDRIFTDFCNSLDMTGNSREGVVSRVVNDHWHEIRKATARWRRVDVAADSSRKLEDLAFAPPALGRYELLAEVVDGKGVRLSENGYRFVVEP